LVAGRRYKGYNIKVRDFVRKVAMRIKKALIYSIVICLLLFFQMYDIRAEEYTSAEKLNIIGVLIGPGTGIDEEYLTRPATRIDGAVLMLKLKGLISEAENYSGTENFVDADEALSDYTRRIMGYLKANPSLGYIGYLDRFDPNAPMTDQMFYKVLLTLLGYEQGSDFEWSETLVMAWLVGMDQISGVGELTVNDLAIAIVEALDSEIKDTGVLFIQQLVNDDVLDLSLVISAGWGYVTAE
jgi:hypothetical protein